MPIEVASRRASLVKLAERRPGALIVDVTSKGAEPWVRFSPFYPHGGIPVPGSSDRSSQSVEGLWQALKVFETADVDPAKLDVTSMKGLKRTARRFGRVLGHRDGLDGTRLLPYADARRRIYLPAYRWVLEHRLADLAAELRVASERQELILLDYTLNGDPANLATPLSHAALLARHLRGDYPS
jgi:hypothetical protein